MTCLAVTSTCLLQTCKKSLCHSTMKSIWHQLAIGNWQLAIGNLPAVNLQKKPLALNLEKHLAPIGLELSFHSLTLLKGDNKMWEELEAIVK